MLWIAWLANPGTVQAAVVKQQPVVLELSVKAEDGRSLSTTPVGPVHTEVDAQVTGGLASVTLRHTFDNPLSIPVDGTYLFPLPQGAAVHQMTFTVGDEVIEGRVMERGQAAATYTAAKEAGHAAALVQEHRPNLFSQGVANLPPGESVVVELHYVHPVPRVDGAYAFHLPLVVGPRYSPPGGDGQGPEAPLPAAPSIAENALDVDITIDAGLPIRGLDSGGLQVAVAAPSEERRVLHLEADTPGFEDDLVVRYETAGPASALGVTTHSDGKERLVQLIVEPPTELAAQQRTPRELVFVIDRSGSMGGAPLDACKRLMRHSLAGLHPEDTFRIVVFDNRPGELSGESLPATDANLARAEEFIDGLIANGGTEMRAGMKAALAPPIEDGRLRLVVLLTDGQIGNEAEVVQLVDRMRGTARIFSLGVGSHPNRYLLESLSRAGRGVARVVGPQDDAAEQAERLAERLATPALTDLRVDWGGAPVRSVTPLRLPDLFLGDSLRVLAQVESAGSWPVTVHGKVGGVPHSVDAVVTVADEPTADSPALPMAWARAQVDEKLALYTLVGAARGSGAQDAGGERLALQADVTALGLEYGLVTPWTSFVAVSARPADDEPVRVADRPPAVYSPSGSAAPEPVEWMAIIGLLMACVAVFWRR